MIMTKYKLNSPVEINYIKIRNNNLIDVFEEDMAYFTNVSTIDLQDNEVPLYKLWNFKALQKLNLSFNNMRKLEIFCEED